jgi:creatinine amidohydrolase
MVALRLAAQKAVLKNRTLNAEGKLRIMVLSDYDFAYELRGKYVSEKDGHAGDIETSRVMAIKPSLVKPACKASFSQLPRFDVVANPENYFPNGFIGDPREASASKGRKINKYVIEQVTKLVEDLQSTSQPPV